MVSVRSSIGFRYSMFLMASFRPMYPSKLMLTILSMGFCAAVTSSHALASQCGSAFGQVQIREGEPLRDQLEILSWNIQKAGTAGWAEDLANISTGVDLAFIQEAAVHAEIPKALPGNLHSIFARGYTTDSLETGVLTLSASSPSGECTLTALEPWLGTPKATSISEYPLLGREERLLTVNLHAVNFTFGVEDLRVQLEALSEVLGNHQGPIILAGDFNTWSDQREILVAGFMRTHGLGPVAFEPDLRTTAFGHALDHIYVRGMLAESAEVFPVTSSDHNPLRVRLAVQ
jgi:endonuclease/exonuclease/phosphatase (EEP) superfamily protein YafD